MCVSFNHSIHLLYRFRLFLIPNPLKKTKWRWCVKLIVWLSSSCSLSQVFLAFSRLFVSRDDRPNYCRLCLQFLKEEKKKKRLRNKFELLFSFLFYWSFKDFVDVNSCREVASDLWEKERERKRELWETLTKDKQEKDVKTNFQENHMTDNISRW